MLVGGVRYDKFEDGVVNGSSYEDDDIMFRAGAIFKPRKDVSVYLSWSQSFEPQTAASQNNDVGGPFAPMTGDQFEGGIKTNLLDRLQANLAAYRIVRKNILQVDTSLPPVNAQDKLRPISVW